MKLALLVMWTLLGFYNLLHEVNKFDYFMCWLVLITQLFARYLGE